MSGDPAAAALAKKAKKKAIRTRVSKRLLVAMQTNLANVDPREIYQETLPYADLLASEEVALFGKACPSLAALFNGADLLKDWPRTTKAFRMASWLYLKGVVAVGSRLVWMDKSDLGSSPSSRSSSVVSPPQTKELSIQVNVDEPPPPQPESSDEEPPPPPQTPKAQTPPPPSRSLSEPSEPPPAPPEEEQESGSDMEPAPAPPRGVSASSNPPPPPSSDDESEPPPAPAPASESESEKEKSEPEKDEKEAELRVSLSAAQRAQQQRRKQLAASRQRKASRLSYSDSSSSDSDSEADVEPAQASSLRARRKATMEQQWYYLDHRDNEHGPFTGTKLKAWYHAGHLPKQLLVKANGEDEYGPITERPELSIKARRVRSRNNSRQDKDKLSPDGQRRTHRRSSQARNNVMMSPNMAQRRARREQKTQQQEVAMKDMLASQSKFLRFMSAFRMQSVFTGTEVYTVQAWNEMGSSSRFQRGKKLSANIKQALENYHETANAMFELLSSCRLYLLESGNAAGSTSQISFSFPGFDTEVFDVGRYAVINPWYFFPGSGDLIFAQNDWEGALHSKCAGKELMQSSPDLEDLYDQGKGEEAKEVMMKSTKNLLHNLCIAQYLNAHNDASPGDVVRYPQVIPQTSKDKEQNIRLHADSMNVQYWLDPPLTKLADYIKDREQDLRVLVSPLHLLLLLRLLVDLRVAKLINLKGAVALWLADSRTNKSNKMAAEDLQEIVDEELSLLHKTVDKVPTTDMLHRIMSKVTKKKVTNKLTSFFAMRPARESLASRGLLQVSPAGAMMMRANHSPSLKALGGDRTESPVMRALKGQNKSAGLLAGLPAVESDERRKASSARK